MNPENIKFIKHEDLQADPESQVVDERLADVQDVDIETPNDSRYLASDAIDYLKYGEKEAQQDLLGEFEDNPDEDDK